MSPTLDFPGRTAESTWPPVWDVQIRLATSEDEAFLRELLAVAADWRGTPGPLDPSLAHYVEGFGQDGDVGVVADDHGAAWARLFSAHAPGFGFVADDVPELSIAVRPEHRGRGLGTALLQALANALSRAGFTRVSLSVEFDNPALRLYERVGFARVGTRGGAWTLVRDLRS
jgi:ribosomal protein S18 acetylase RimI-like enzyme